MTALTEELSEDSEVATATTESVESSEVEMVYVRAMLPQEDGTVMVAWARSKDDDEVVSAAAVDASVDDKVAILMSTCGVHTVHKSTLTDYRLGATHGRRRHARKTLGVVLVVHMAVKACGALLRTIVVAATALAVGGSCMLSGNERKGGCQSHQSEGLLHDTSTRNE